jgi:hypothetical protein
MEMGAEINGKLIHEPLKASVGQKAEGNPPVAPAVNVPEKR